MKKFLLFSVLLLFVSLPAAAQDHTSLKNLPEGTLFKDPEQKFSIKLPAEKHRFGPTTETGADKEINTVARYEWILREGSITISVRTFEKITYSPIMIDALTAITMKRFKDEGIEIISRKEFDQGTAHGGELVRKEDDGQIVIFRLLGAGPSLFTLNIRLDKSARDAEKLMKAAAESFIVLDAAKKVPATKR